MKRPGVKRPGKTAGQRALRWAGVAKSHICELRAEPSKSSGQVVGHPAYAEKRRKTASCGNLRIIQCPGGGER